MEISLVEEDAKIEMIEGYKVLRYKIKNNGKNINKVHVFIQWLKLMNAEKGENGIVSYCTKCYAFFYFQNLREKNFAYHSDCGKFDFSEFCEYCGELFNEESICCLRKCFDMFTIYSYTVFFDIFGYCILFVPIITFMWLFFTIFKIIISKRNKRYDDINYIDTKLFNSFEYLFSYILLFSMTFVYSLAFFVSYFFTIYFFQLFYMIKIKRQKIDDANKNIIRY